MTRLLSSVSISLPQIIDHLINAGILFPAYFGTAVNPTTNETSCWSATNNWCFISGLQAPGSLVVWGAAGQGSHSPRADPWLPWSSRMVVVLKLTQSSSLSRPYVRKSRYYLEAEVVGVVLVL
jgi:hypothetical protein